MAPETNFGINDSHRLGLSPHEREGLWLVHKPAGLSTHQVSPNHPGFQEILSNLSGVQFEACHRLDRETSGAMLMASDRRVLSEVSQLFQAQKIQKTYIFVTDRLSSKDSYTIRSKIEKTSNKFVSRIVNETDFNAETQFQKIKSEGRWTLWSAHPFTGKPHQIRLHAQSLGIPILGDTIYSGSPFPGLLLHSLSLKMDWKTQSVFHESPPPQLYENLDLLSDPLLCRWILQAHRRHILYSNHQMVRWIHDRKDTYPVTCDQLGEVLYFSLYPDTPPQDADIQRIEKFVHLHGIQHWFARWMIPRGFDPLTKVTWSSSLPKRWTAVENQTQFELRTDTGTSPGLFLDHRDARSWIRSESSGRRVLNLFSYTGGFSVNAARGGASEVVSVDTSASALTWAQRNFEINGLVPKNYTFKKMDSLEFLELCQKKEKQFDIIICDPPSFSRGTHSVFSLTKNFENLVVLCLQTLAKGGDLLFSINFEAWNDQEFERRLETATTTLERKQKGLKFKVSKQSHSSWDYELPHEERILKTRRIQRFS